MEIAIQIPDFKHPAIFVPVFALFLYPLPIVVSSGQKSHSHLAFRSICLDSAPMNQFLTALFNRICLLN